MKRNHDLREAQLKLHQLFDDGFISWSDLVKMKDILQENKVIIYN